MDDQPKNCCSTHTQIEAEMSSYDTICLKENADHEVITPGLSCSEDVESYYESVLLLPLGTLHYMIGEERKILRLEI